MEVYGRSVSKLLEATKPELQLKPWLFRHVPPNFWSDRTKHKEYFDWLLKHMELSTMDHWYEVTAADVKRYGGVGLLANYYANSLINALKTVYPEHEWLEWKFSKASKSFWEDEIRRKQYMSWLKRHLNYSKPEDWYKLNRRVINSTGGMGSSGQWF
jgi:hypothetical protein